MNLNSSQICLGLLALLLLTVESPGDETFAKNWHHWRGPEANGVSRTAKPPITWSEEKNIKWKVPIKGKGNASPIIWNNKIFLLTAINTGRVDPSKPKPEDQPKRVFGIKHPNTFYKFNVICLDRETGKEIWRRTAREYVPHEGTHHDADFASASPMTDGERLYCWFGSAGLFCYDLDGKKLWERDLGKAYVGASLGEGCSPVVFKDRLVVVRDHARQSTIEVLNSKTGKTVWKKDRDEKNAWATPRIIEHSGKVQVITAASKKIRSYDLEDGDIIWECGGLTGNVTPCPVVDKNNVYCMSGYEGYSLLAIPLSSKGDITGSNQIAWSKKEGTPYVPSPILYDNLLYYTQSNQGILTGIEASSGETLLKRTRLTGISNIYASPVGADGRLYFVGRRGTTLVVARGMKLNILSTNRLEDQFNASPAIAGTQLFLRGRKFLYCIEENNQNASKDEVEYYSTSSSVKQKNPVTSFTKHVQRNEPINRASENSNWTRFRGPNGTGISHAKTIPTQWTKEDYNWIVDLPGEGHGSPVVFGDNLYVLCGDPESAKRILVCVDSKHGKQKWTREFESNKHRLHHSNSFGSGTPAVDKHGVVVTFADPEKLSLVALDHEGTTLWERDFGPYDAINGSGNSPIIVDDQVILTNIQLDANVLVRAGILPKSKADPDPNDSSFISVDRKTGKTHWEVKRKTFLSSYATPCVRHLKDGKSEIIFIESAYGITGVDSKSGKVNWETNRLLPSRTVASPVVAGDLVFGSHGRGVNGEVIVAVRAGGTDKKPEVAYEIKRSAPLTPTPLVKDDLAFLWADNGIVTCIEHANGKVVWRERVRGDYYASPIWVNGYLYCADRRGNMVVISGGREFKKVSVNEIGEPSFATPAIANGIMYLRSRSKLYSLGGKKL